MAGAGRGSGGDWEYRSLWSLSPGRHPGSVEGYKSQSRLCLLPRPLPGSQLRPGMVSTKHLLPTLQGAANDVTVLLMLGKGEGLSK